MELPKEIAFWLTQMGLHHTMPLAYEALAGGVSGSKIYRLELSGGAVVLKAT